jgi:hypothetical protein
MDFTDLIVLTGVVQDTLGGRRFSGVNVRHDSDITYFGEVFLRHDCTLQI